MDKLRLRVLILNWRDIKNPRAGGAEILTHEMAKKWVSWGHEVTQISARFTKSKNTETVDGIKIIRVGKWWSVHFFAFFYYIKNLRSKTDVILDEVHGLPFFSALYEPKKTILFACEVADRLFYEVFPGPIADIGIVLEKIYLFIYRNIRVLAISKSTAEDLMFRGFNKNKITTLPMGLTIPKGIKKGKKETLPTLIYLSRINKQKGIEDAVEAFRIISSSIPECKLWIAGSGDLTYVNKIKGKIKDLKLTKKVTFFGYVSEKKKFNLLSRAHMMIFPSMHEGWGIVIAEAGVMGTPCVVYKVAGVRDVVNNGKRGILVSKNRPDLLAKAVIKYIENDKLYKDLLLKIKSFEKEVGWDNTAKVAFSIMKKTK